MRLVWHRRDLRLADNTALAAASAEDTIVPLFVFDPTVLDHASPPRVAFMLDSLKALQSTYRNQGADLLIESGRPTEVIPRIVNKHDIDVVHWNTDYSGLAQRRDEAVRSTLADRPVTVQTHHDAVCHAPGTIRTNAGDPYQVFTYYWRKWQDRQKDEVAPTPEPESLVSIDGGAIPPIEDLGFHPPTAAIPPGGTEPARTRLSEFLSEDVFRYESARDRPAAEATSGLSPHLKFGTIGPREVHKRTIKARSHAKTEEERDSVDEFRAQLAWREFYTQVLYFNPSVVTENYTDYEHDIEWRRDPDGLSAWKAGKTGYPIVDAGMRQLQEEAFMHNRVRMIVASFLTKDLHIDWRRGYAWFRDRLVDHDTANDNGGWQWAASTGTDAQPYFRVFNPMTQGERYDPEATYIKQYVPELAEVSPRKIHSWDELSESERRHVAPEYPDPIVDHGERREAAIAMFEHARGDS